jgi:hypothetical protein
MNENQADAVLREKILYRYSSAIERGDFETAAAILAQAEGDPQLEQMIMEINAALVTELPPAPRVPARSEGTLWHRIKAVLRPAALGIGLSVLVLVLVVGVLALIGPAIGNIFVEVASIPTPDESRFRKVYDATPAPYQQNSNRFEAYPAPAEPTATFYYTRPTAAEGPSFLIGPATAYPGPEDFNALQATATPYATRQNGIAANTTAGQLRMVARNGYLAITVADTRKTRDAVSEVISGYAGEDAFILSSSEQGIQGSDQPAIFMQLRVPVARYDAVMNRLVGLALTVDARQEQAADVTAEYVDTQARIRELETAIDRLLEIARTAQNTEDLLTVEKALSDRRAELEAMKGRAQYLSQTAALSLIQLELRPKIVFPTPTPTSVPTPETWRPQDTAQRSVIVFLRDLRRFGDWLIEFGITTLPWILVVGLVGFVVYKMWRKK